MSWHALGHFLKDAAPVVAMFTSLFLLWQGQGDRRRLRQEQRRAQVDQVALTDAMRRIDRTEIEEALRPVSDDVVSEFTVRNDSKAVVEVLGATEIHPMRPDLLSTAQLANDIWPVLLAPGEVSTLLLSEGWIPGFRGRNRGRPYVVVLVRDAYGRLWRKRSDTAAAKMVAPDQVPTVGARVALCLHRHWWGRPFWWLLYSPLDRQLDRMRDLDPDHTPFALRVSRWVWGRWDTAVDDPWLYPGIVPWKSARRKKQ